MTTVSRDYEDVNKLFANILASKEEQYVKHVNPFMTAVANRLENSFKEFVGRTLATETKKEMVEKFERILREIFLGEKPKPIIPNFGPPPDFKVQKTEVNAPVRQLKSQHGEGIVFSFVVNNPPKSLKPMKAPIRSIPNGIHASWHSIVDNGQDYNG